MERHQTGLAARSSPGLGQEAGYEPHQRDDDEPHGYAHQDGYRDAASRCQIVRLIAVRLTVALRRLVVIVFALLLARGGGRIPNARNRATPRGL